MPGAGRNQGDDLPLRSARWFLERPRASGLGPSPNPWLTQPVSARRVIVPIMNVSSELRPGELHPFLLGWVLVLNPKRKKERILGLESGLRFGEIRGRRQIESGTHLRARHGNMHRRIESDRDDSGQEIDDRVLRHDPGHPAWTPRS